MLRKLFAIVLIPALLAACGTTQTISTSEKAAVKAAYLSESVPVPPNMYYLGPGGAAGLAFGALGALAAAPSIEKSRVAFQEQAGAGAKTIDRIVLEEFRAQLGQSKKISLSPTKQPGYSTISASVTSYGFSIPHGFSSKLVPILGIRCEMTDSSGRVVWSATENTRPLGNPVEPIDADLIKSSERARAEAWQAAAKALIGKIMASY